MKLMRGLVINCSPVKNGATAEIVRIVAEQLAARMTVKSICIDDFQFSFCRGCRSCHLSAECILDDDIPAVLNELNLADVIVCVSPSYWADIPGQFKAFIDRCTPWCNTHDPHAVIAPGKRGYSIALRTGPGMKECERIIQSIEHFYGHLEIAPSGHLGLCAVESKMDIPARIPEITDFCSTVF